MRRGYTKLSANNYTALYHYIICLSSTRTYIYSVVLSVFKSLGCWRINGLYYFCCFLTKDLTLFKSYHILQKLVQPMYCPNSHEGLYWQEQDTRLQMLRLHLVNVRSGGLALRYTADIKLRVRSPAAEKAYNEIFGNTKVQSRPRCNDQSVNKCNTSIVC
jgi:hypothetical protein